MAMDLFFFTPAAISQPGIDSATREVDRSMRQMVETKVQESTKRKPPKVVEGIVKEEEGGPVFELKSVTLEGVESFPKEDFDPIIDKYQGKEVDFSKLKVMAKEIEREYLKKGVIAACFLPPQDIQEGEVTVRVVEAKMGELEVKKGLYFSTERVKYYWTIEPGEVLRYDKMSRSLQFINKNPDRNVKAALRAGKVPETTDVVIDMATNFPIHFTMTFDREGAVSTGKARKGFGIVNNSLFGLDDTLILGYTGGKSFDGFYGYHKVPITNFGTSIMYGYSQSKAFPQKDYQRFEISSKSNSYSAYLYQDIFKKDEYKGELSAGLEKSMKRVVAESSGLPPGLGVTPGSTGDLNVDRLTTGSLGLTLIGRGQGSSTSVKPEFYQGLNLLGARRKNEFSSRQAENTPSRFMYTATFKQALVKNFQASLKMKAQFASEKLTPQQEMYLGGIDSVRGYPSGDYLADSGVYANTELLIPAWFIPDWVRVPYGERPIKDEITGVLFFDYGYGRKRGQIEGEDTTRRMAGLGWGVRMRLINQALLRLEWGIPLDPVVNYPLTERGGNRPRLHLSIDFQDDWPEEVERFSKVYKEEYMSKSAWEIMNAEMRNPSSEFRRELCRYLELAKKAEEMGHAKEAGRYYKKALTMGRTAHKQVEIYLKENYRKIFGMRTASEEAKKLYEDGDYEKAKELWQKILDDGKIPPLKVEIAKPGV
jgi:hemolysin activation/secretion protein